MGINQHNPQSHMMPLLPFQQLLQLWGKLDYLLNVVAEPQCCRRADHQIINKPQQGTTSWQYKWWGEFSLNAALKIYWKLDSQINNRKPFSVRWNLREDSVWIWNIWLNAFSHFLLQRILVLTHPVGRFGGDHNIFKQTYSTSYLWYAHKHCGFNTWISVTSCTKMKLSEDMRRHARKCVIQFQILNEPNCNPTSLPNQ